MALFKKKSKANMGGKIYINATNKGGHFEDYNRLKDNVLYLNADGKNKVIQIESSVMAEGKTTVVCNLAVGLGLTNKKVIVVDLDFRRPRVHRLFSLARDVGIAEYCLGDATKEQIIKKTEYENVDVITRGGQVYNSSLLLLSDKFKNFIAELREEYDYVFLDCAPVLQISDFIHISKVSDGVLFMVAYGTTTKAQVSEAIKDLRKNGANILGTVLTMYEKDKDGQGYSRGKYYRYKYYEDSPQELEADDQALKETK